MDDLKTLPERFQSLVDHAVGHHGESPLASDALELAYFALERQVRVKELEVEIVRLGAEIVELKQNGG